MTREVRFPSDDEISDFLDDALPLARKKAVKEGLELEVWMLADAISCPSKTARTIFTFCSGVCFTLLLIIILPSCDSFSFTVFHEGSISFRIAAISLYPFQLVPQGVLSGS